VAGLRFFTVLGVDRETDAVGAAATKWPGDLVRPFVGASTSTGPFRDLVEYLQSALSFRSARPGQGGLDAAGKAQLGLWAELFVTNPPIRTPLVVATMPDVAFYLEDTAQAPAALFATHASDGSLDIVIQGLPVRIELPFGVLLPLRSRAESASSGGGALPDVRTTAPFEPMHWDSLEIVLSDVEVSSVRVRVNVRLTSTGDILIEPVVPISVGPCRHWGIPCKGIHDLRLLSTLFPRHVPAEHIPSEIPLQWARHDLGFAFRSSSWPSALIARTIDPDPEWGFYRDLLAAIGVQREQGDDAIELVAEDLVFPFDLPLPVHGRLGLRRRLLQDIGGDAYNLDSAPLTIEVLGTEITIFRFVVQSSDLEGESPIAFEVAWRPAGDADGARARTDLVSVAEDGSIAWGGLFAHKPKLFRIAGLDIHVAAARMGLSFPRLIDRADAPWSWLILLADFELRRRSDPPPAVDIEAKSGKGGPLLVRDLGWRAGSPSFGGLHDPAGLEYKVARRRVVIHELGLVGDSDGGLFLSMNGGLDWGADFGAFQDRTSPAQGGGPEAGNAFGVYLYRLRFRLGDGSPAVQLDGARINLRRGPTELSGFGMLSEYERDGSRYREFGFDIHLALRALGRDLEIGAQLLYGSVSGSETFKYWLAALQVSPIPVGAVELHDVRVLGAGNMTPVLQPADGTEQPMRLLRWFKQGGTDALALPIERKLTAWAPKDQSLAFGVGLTVVFGGSKAVRLAGFLFVHCGPDEAGVLVGIEVYMLEGPKPIAYGALEWDGATDRFQLLIGFDVTLGNLLGRHLPDFLANIGALTGTFYASNRPTTIAFGYYNDPASWFTVRFGYRKVAELDVVAAVCYHRVVDPDPNDPTVEALNVFGLVVSMKGGIDLGRLGKMQIYATLQWVSGLWRNEALATGNVLVVEAGIRIKLFRCFRFGASIKVDCAWLGPSDAQYERHSAVIRIETPWYLPDVTIRWDWTRGLPQPERMEVVSLPLASASALGLSIKHATPIGTTRPAGLPAGRGVYDMASLRSSVTVAPSADDFAQLTPVATDATIALDLAAAVEAEATALPTTPPDAGLQSSNELATRYRVATIGIRRRAHFGAQAGVWSDLIDPVTTELPPLADLPTGDPLEARFRSEVRMEWDADVQRIGRTEPRRLLINGKTPFTLTSRSPDVDEALVAWWPDWPCCPPAPPEAPWHWVTFGALSPGLRAPTSSTFSTSASVWRWLGRRAPMIVVPNEDSGPPPSTTSAALVPVPPAYHLIAMASFDELAHSCEIETRWGPQHGHSLVVLEAYRGLTRIASVSLSLRDESPAEPIRFQHTSGFNAVLLRSGTDEFGGGRIELTEVRYRTVREVRATVVDSARCRGQRDHTLGRGQLAWLPNHDYEITINARVDLDYQRAGTQTAALEQRAFFRTKGLPGLNAAARTGDELEPHIESQYPAPGSLVYRREPFVLAFRESFNIFAPVDHAPNPDDPAERQQLLEWQIAVEKHDANGATRLSETATDWLASRRAGDAPQWPVLSADVMVRRTRQATTTNRFRQRFEHLLLRPGGCGTAQDALHGSQVLVHAPVDPAGSGADARWAPDQSYRATLRQRGAPFIDRSSFEAADLAAMKFAAGSGTPSPWGVTDGRIHLIAPSPSIAQYALVGATDWDHLHARVVVHPAGAMAGIALAVAGTPTVSQAVLALVDARTNSPLLRLTEVANGGSRLLGEAALPAAMSYTLELTAFDDRWRAQVGDVSIDVPRSAVRTGRVALVVRGGGQLERLTVSGLNAYVVPYRSSRYDDFASHVESFRNVSAQLTIGAAGTATSTVSALLAATSTEVSEVMAPGVQSEQRERLFERWVRGLALPLLTSPSELSMSRIVADSGATQLLILESPEPLAFSNDVALSIGRRTQPSPPTSPIAAWLAQLERAGSTIVGPPLPTALARLHHLVWWNQLGAMETFELPRDRAPGASIVITNSTGLRKPQVAAGPSPSTSVQLFDRDSKALSAITPLTGIHAYTAVPARILTSGDERRAIVIPVTGSGSSHAPFGLDTLRLSFTIERARYRVHGVDPASRYTDSARLFLWLGGVVDDTM
jgi:hypothetical protein